MKPALTPLVWLVSLLAALTAHAVATTRYVNVNSANPVPPYLGWNTAARNIQAAINVAVSTDTILVTNGVYSEGGHSVGPTGSTSNRVSGEGRILTIKSVNGPAVTVIKGYQVPGTIHGASAVRCVYLTGGSVLSGFTLTNGATYTQDQNGGGGVYCTALSAIITNCVIVGNAARQNGGGVSSGTLINCTLMNNYATNSGGGVFSSTLYNCLLTGNFSGYTGGAAIYGNLINCTIVSNSAVSYGGTAWNSDFQNCIVYYNHSYLTAADDSSSYGHWTNCCTPSPPFSGLNNFTNPPQFADLPHADYHLNAASPCINTGSNSSNLYATDIEGNNRSAGGRVDVGAYEFQSPIHYVALSNSTPVSPYTNWLTAATNIQDAVDASITGDFIVVSNGTYKTGSRAVTGSMTNRIVVDKAVTIQSVNGPSATIIAGAANIVNNPPIGIRCIYLTNGSALMGFTLTNGATMNIGDAITERSGGGAWCSDNSVVISNCVFTFNSAAQYGGGAFRGTLLNCTFTNNTASIGGGAVSNSLFHCILLGNSTLYQNAHFGGGIYGSTAQQCLLVGNQSKINGGNGGGAAFSTLEFCVLSNNYASGNGGGAFVGTLNNCLLSSNSVTTGGGGACSNILNNCVLNNNKTLEEGGGAFRSTLNNCTVVSNTAGLGGGVYQTVVNNSIVIDNLAATGPNFGSTNLFNYCCTSPLPTNGFGNITNEPVFADLVNANLRLQSNSPCINAGNNSYAAFATDLDRNPRIVAGTVDMGAFEFTSPSSALSYNWAQQYGFPTDGSQDYADADGDGMNNWAEWRSGTSPTDSTSLLQVAPPAADASSATITWQSVNNILYYIQRTANFSTPFTTIQSNIVGQAGTTSYTDTNTADSALFFYRVGVQ